MDLEEIKSTDVWNLYEKGRDYHRLTNIYTDTNKNYRMYNGDQWEGLKISGVEPIKLNFIKPIVKYKVGTINSNLWAINFSSENIENREFRRTAEKTCELLNKKASKIWEKDSLDTKVRKITKDAAINDEGIMYVTYDEETQMPVNEILSKNDVYYGNENDQDIQKQPYIIIKRRMPVSLVQEMALREGVSKEKLMYITGDNDNFEEAGEASKYEKDDMCTVVTKMYKENGTVKYETSTRYVTLHEPKDNGTTLYPIEHMTWEEKEGSARGEGEVRNLIANQIEVNKTLMRRLITVKMTAYPTKVINKDKIQNVSDIDKVGVTLMTKNGQTVDDVNKIVGMIQPAQMSTDVEKLQENIVSSSRELAGAGDIATGDVNPEDASGKAILAVQQAQQQPLVEQVMALKAFIEGIARIWLDYIINYSQNGLMLEEEMQDPNTGETIIQPVNVPQSILLELKATVKVDITPKGAFDKYARELSLENLLKGGFFNPQMSNQLRYYAEALPDDSTMPKQDILEICDKIDEEKRRIAEINARAEMMKQRANQFINSDPDAQATQLIDGQAEAQARSEAQAVQNPQEEVQEVM